MGWQYTPYALLSLATAVFSAGIAVYAVRRRGVPGARMGALFMVAVAVWTAANAVELGVAELSDHLFWSKVSYAGIVVVPVAWFGFTAEYTGRGSWVRGRNLALLFVVPVSMLLFVATTGYHRLFWSDWALDTSGSFVGLDVEYGPVFWAWISYAYALLLAGVVMVVVTLARSRSLYGRQGAVLLFGAAAPWIGNVAHILDLSPINIDPTPFCFLLTGAAMAYGISRFGLLDVVPVARAAVVEDMDDGVIVLDSQNRVLDVNPAARSICAVPPSRAVGMPVDEVVRPGEILEEVLSGGEGRRQVRVGPARGPLHREYEVTLSSLKKQRGGRPVRFVVVRDVTERVKAEGEVRRLNAELEERVIERTAELRESEKKYRSIFENAVEGVFQITPEGRLVTANPAMARIFGHDSPEALLRSVPDVSGGLLYPDERGTKFVERMRESGAVSGFEVEVRRRDGGTAWVSVGARSVRDESGRLVGYEGLVEDITARREARRTLERRVAALTGIAAGLTVDRPLETTLDQLAAGVVGTTAALACSVYLAEGDSLVLAGVHGLPPGYWEAARASWRSGRPSPAREAFEARSAVLREGGRRLLLDDPGFAPVRGDLTGAPWDTVHATPLVARGEALGVINAYFPPDEGPTPDAVTFLKAVADQAAVAVENSRLFAAARGAAVLQERQRISRELHDSVSQALYGIALGSRTARTLIDRDPDRAAEPMEYVLSLAEAGLAEMRALIFELRPEALEAEGLVAALDRQAAALRARHGIEVNLDPSPEPRMTPETKEVLYRIAQEALQNTVKHAGAGRVDISVRNKPGTVEVEVRDDGAGFDPSARFPGHLGLSTMRERAESLGGLLEIESAPGEGTRVRASVPLQDPDDPSSNGDGLAHGRALPG